MKVRLLSKLVGHRAGEHFASADGGVVELPEALAQALCAKGHALSATDNTTHQTYLKAREAKHAFRINPSGQKPAIILPPTS